MALHGVKRNSIYAGIHKPLEGIPVGEVDLEPALLPSSELIQTEVALSSEQVHGDLISWFLDPFYQ